MNRKTWCYYLRFYRESYHRLILTIIFSILQSLIVLPIAFLVRYVFDQAIPKGATAGLIYAGIFMLGLILLNCVLTLLTRYLSLNQTKMVIRDIREELLVRCYSFSRSFYNKADLAKLHASIVQDTQRLDIMSNAIISLFLPSLIVAFAIFGVLIYISPSLSLIMVCTIPPLYLMNRIFVKNRRINWINASHRSFEKFSKGVLFVLQMMDLTRAQTAEQLELKRQKKYLEVVRLTSQSNALLFAAYHSIQNGILAVSGIIILIVGGMAVGTGSISLGSLISFYVAMSLMSFHMRNMVSSVPSILEGNESLSTLYHLAHVDDATPYAGNQTMTFQGKIALREVDFSYENEKILRSVKLTIEPGAKVSIIGPNGVGKSTIVNLVLGFYRPQKGLLFADDHPYPDIDITHLRQGMGVVMQNPIIFPGTIRENIVYGCPEASLESIIRASELATAHEFIDALPEKYDTLMGEQGTLLSGGQCQRIAIARALLREPKLLILDEPTNHLDEASVNQLMQNLKSMEGNPSMLIITQNMNIARQTDCIYVLRRDGCIVHGEHQTDDQHVHRMKG